MYRPGLGCKGIKLQLFAKFKVGYIILTDTWLRTPDTNMGNSYRYYQCYTNIITILYRYLDTLEGTGCSDLVAQIEDILLPRLQNWVILG